MTLSEKLQRLCEIHRRTNQRQFAAELGVSKSSLNRWLSGAATPDVREALRLAKVFDVPLDYLANDEIQELPRSVEPDVEEMAVVIAFRGLRDSHGLRAEEAISKMAGSANEAWRPGAVRDVPSRSLDPDKDTVKEKAKAAPSGPAKN